MNLFSICGKFFLVHDENEDRFAADSGLVDGGERGQDDQEVEKSLRDELNDCHNVKI